MSGTEKLGECTNFEIDNTNQFLIAVFAESSRLLVVDIHKRTVAYRMAGPSEILLRNVQIDETGCLLGALNKERNAIDFYTFEWQYAVEEPKRVKKDQNDIDEILK